MIRRFTRQKKVVKVEPKDDDKLLTWKVQTYTVTDWLQEETLSFVFQETRPPAS